FFFFFWWCVCGNQRLWIIKRILLSSAQKNDWPIRFPSKEPEPLVAMWLVRFLEG
ncbi:unnamed protein product, partial [Brassica oleracea]